MQQHCELNFYHATSGKPGLECWLVQICIICMCTASWQSAARLQQLQYSCTCLGTCVAWRASCNLSFFAPNYKLRSRCDVST
jgi:hypothetical protein